MVEISFLGSPVLWGGLHLHSLGALFTSLILIVSDKLHLLGFNRNEGLSFLLKRLNLLRVRLVHPHHYYRRRSNLSEEL